MLRRASALLALIAVTASPAVMSTRLFCQYTGVEIVGCDESRIPAHAQLRDDCCVERTFHPIDPTRVAPDDSTRLAAAPVAVAIGAVMMPQVDIIARAPSARQDGISDAGPPVFLTNRADAQWACMTVFN